MSEHAFAAAIVRALNEPDPCSAMRATMELAGLIVPAELHPPLWSEAALCSEAQLTVLVEIYQMLVADTDGSALDRACGGTGA